MPYRRTYRRCKFPSRKRHYKKKSFPQRVTTVVNKKHPTKYQVWRGTTNPVLKNWTLVNSLTNIPWTSHNDPNNRQSLKAFSKNLQIKGVLTSQTTRTTFVRLLIVKGLRSGADTIISTNLTYNPNTASSMDDIYLTTNPRFVHVKYDKTFKLQAQAAGSVYPAEQLIDINIKLNDFHKFNETEVDNDNEEPTNNSSYYMYICTDEPTETEIDWEYSARLSFKDLI